MAVSSRRIPRSISALPELFEFVERFYVDERLDGRSAPDVTLVLEELFSNQVKYQASGAQTMEIALERKDRTLVITLRDTDVNRFDVSVPRPVDVTAPLSERKPGGLGLHFIHRIADGIGYDYSDRCSTITVTKRLEP